VLGNSKPYVRWRDFVLARFEKLYAVDPRDELGDVVPREAVDLDVDFEPTDTERMVNNYLLSIDYSANPLLNTPEIMLQIGFEGTPYVFDLLEDRRKRIDW
jgi:hypothetical protein